MSNNYALSKTEINELGKGYASNDKGVMREDYEKKTMSHELAENKYKFIHIAIVAGVTWFLLTRHQSNEGEYMIWSG